MNSQALFKLVIFGLFLMIAVVCCSKYQQQLATPVPNQLVPAFPESAKGKKFDVKKIIVLSGDNFDLTLRDSGRILAKLPVSAVVNSKDKVIDLLNHIQNPRVILQEKQPDGHWVVDFFIDIDGKETNLSDWLELNNLVYK